MGLFFAFYQFYQYHWVAGFGFISSSLLTSGLITFGGSFVKEKFTGVVLVILTSVLGLYSFIFESRGLDIDLDIARNEAALAFLQPNTQCSINNKFSIFQQGAKACITQQGIDKLQAVGDGAKQAYLPIELDFADKVVSSSISERPDLCKKIFIEVYEKCPEAFASLSIDNIEKLSSNY